jgi:hypothetical protein
MVTGSSGGTQTGRALHAPDERREVRFVLFEGCESRVEEKTYADLASACADDGLRILAAMPVRIRADPK